MDLSVAIRAAAIEGKDVQRPSGQSRMPGQHVYMALLAQQMDASSQKLGIIRTVRRVTIHAVLASRRMLPKKRTTLFRMTGVADVIGRMLEKHLAAPAAMRTVAGSAAYLCVAKLGAKHVGRALRECFALICVTSETSFLDGKRCEHILRLLHLKSIQIRPGDL